MCIVLYVLYCTVLYCTVLYCIVLYYCTVLYCIVLYCTVLYVAPLQARTLAGNSPLVVSTEEIHDIVCVYTCRHIPVLHKESVTRGGLRVPKCRGGEGVYDVLTFQKSRGARAHLGEDGKGPPLNKAPPLHSHT